MMTVNKSWILKGKYGLYARQRYENYLKKLFPKSEDLVWIDDDVKKVMKSYKPEVIEALVARAKANGVI